MGSGQGYLLSLEKALMKAFLGVSIRADPRINSKLHVWKKNYGSLYQMLERSGFGWNDETKTISDKEDIWDEYLKNDPFARSMRYTSWPHYHHWCEIFGKDRTTGDIAEDFNTADKDQLNVHDVVSEGNKNTDDVILDEKDDMSFCQHASSSTGKKSKSKRKRQTDSTGEKLVELMETFCDQNKSGLSEITKRIGVEYDLQTQIKSVYEELGKLKGVENRCELSVTQKVCAAKLFFNKTKELVLFFSIPDEAKVVMVHELLDADI